MCSSCSYGKSETLSTGRREGDAPGGALENSASPMHSGDPPLGRCWQVTMVRVCTGGRMHSLQLPWSWTFMHVRGCLWPSRAHSDSLAHQEELSLEFWACFVLVWVTRESGNRVQRNKTPSTENRMWVGLGDLEAVGSLCCPVMLWSPSHIKPCLCDAGLLRSDPKWSLSCWHNVARLMSEPQFLCP